MTDAEFDDKLLELIEILRSMRRAHPNGRIGLLYYAQQLFDELTDPPNFED